MWKVIFEGTVLNACATLADAMKFAQAYGKFVTITDGTNEIVGKFGVDQIVDEKLPDGNDYTWKMRRDENHRSWRKLKM